MNRIILTCSFLFLSIFMFGQTKFISHKSHSGKMENFSINSDGNLGWNPSMDKKFNYDTMLKMDSSLQNFKLKNNPQKLDSVSKDSLKKDSLKTIPNPKIQPKKIPQMNPKSEIIQYESEVFQMSVHGTENNTQNIPKNWLWLFTLIVPIAYIIAKKN